MHKFLINNCEFGGIIVSRELSEIERQLIKPEQLKRMFIFYEEKKEVPIFTKERDEKKPHIAYVDLIANAILGSDRKMLTLSEIYQWIKNNYKYFNKNDKIWQNSVRHNLSINKMFRRLPRDPKYGGRGSLWSLDLEMYSRMNKNRNRAQEMCE